MLDIKFIRENLKVVKDSAIAKGFDISFLDDLVTCDEERRSLIAKIDKLNSEKKNNTDREKGKEIKDSLKEKEERFREVLDKFEKLMLRVPNPSALDVKIGTEADNEIVKTWGTIPAFDFKIRDHVEIGELTDSIDIERGTKVAQSGFYYLKNGGALLELALVNYAMKKLVSKGFVPVITPNVAKEKSVVGCGYQARSDKERQIYHIEGEDLDLIGTAEITLMGMHSDEVLNGSELPIKYAGFSYCYRTEAGSYGKDVRGILRVHEFRKTEMVVICKPEESDIWHEKLREIEEEIWQELEIPYQVIKMASGDLGSAAARKYDIEAWMPSQNKYREVTSTSVTTDFQTRRLNIRAKINNETVYPHALNGTVFSGRPIIAIMENYQREDGSFEVPAVLRDFVGKDIIEIKK